MASRKNMIFLARSVTLFPPLVHRESIVVVNCTRIRGKSEHAVRSSFDFMANAPL